MRRPFEERAKAVARRAGDPNDWEYVALAWALDAPIWTYDHDFRRMEGVRAIDTASIRARH
jgi:predicted nucleic acid-binding protein